MFYSSLHPFARLSSISEIEDEARIPHGVAAKTGGCHVMATEELLDRA
jgi:hypothetical protein